MIITQLRAGMGNQMFQYAFGKALAKKHNTTLSLDLKYLQDHGIYKKILKETSRNYDLDVFNIQSSKITTKSIHNYLLWPFGEMKNIIGRFYNYIYQKIIGLQIIRENKFGFDVRYLDNGQEQYIIGYRQSYKYFESINEDLKKEFTPINIPENIHTLISKLSQYETICINVRRGDFLTDPLLKSKGPDYYFAGLKYIANKIKNKDNIYIIVVSDDILWCEDNLHFDYPTIYLKPDISGNKQQFHWRIMSHCKHFVGSNSSYLWRAIWRNRNPDKYIVLPKQWFADPNFDDNHIIPDYWNAIRI